MAMLKGFHANTKGSATGYGEMGHHSAMFSFRKDRRPVQIIVGVSSKFTPVWSVCYSMFSYPPAILKKSELIPSQKQNRDLRLDYGGLGLFCGTAADS